MDWKNASAEQIRAKIMDAKRQGRGITISPTWLETILEQRVTLAKLASREPLFFNPLVVMAAERLRDRILADGL